jgi:hypothetical protein
MLTVATSYTCLDFRGDNMFASSCYQHTILEFCRRRSSPHKKDSFLSERLYLLQESYPPLRGNCSSARGSLDRSTDLFMGQHYP